MRKNTQTQIGLEGSPELCDETYGDRGTKSPPNLNREFLGHASQHG